MRGPERINAHVRQVRKIGRVELFAPQNSGVDNGCAAKASFNRIEPCRDIDEQVVAARTARRIIVFAIEGSRPILEVDRRCEITGREPFDVVHDKRDLIADIDWREKNRTNRGSSRRPE